MKGRVEHWFSGYVRWLILHKVRHAIEQPNSYSKILFRLVVLSRIIPKGKVSRSGTTHERNYPSIRFGSRFTRGDPLVKESYRDGLVSLSPGIDFRLIVPTNPRDIKEYLGNFRFEITTLWIQRGIPSFFTQILVFFRGMRGGREILCW